MTASRQNVVRTISAPRIGDVLTVGDCQDIVGNYLQYGGLAVVPSECGYALAVLPTSTSAIRCVDALLDHSKDPIPLTCDSAAQALQFADLGVLHMRLIAACWPGQLTLVAPARAGMVRRYDGRRLAANLHAGQTLGLRVSLSAVERQLSSEAKFPLTSAAIRDDQGGLLTSFDEAIDLIMSRLPRLDGRETSIVGVRRQGRIPAREHSTVVELKDRILKVVREGAVPEQSLRPLLTRVARAEYADAT